MYEAKCPTCGAKISVFAKIESGVVSCKSCGDKYKCVYPVAWHEWIIEFGLTIVAPLVLALAYYFELIHRWVLLALLFALVAVALLIVPKLRKWVPHDDT